MGHFFRNRVGLFWRRLLMDNFVIRWAKRQAQLTIFGPVNFQGLSAAIRFDLFTLLAERGTMKRSEIARELTISDRSARNLLTLLVSGGVLKKARSKDPNDPAYRNVILGQHYLNRKSPHQITALVEMYHFIFYRGMFHYFESLKSERPEGLMELPGAEPTFEQRLAHHPELEKIFQNSMQQLSALANPWLVEYVDFSSSRHVLDVGGGDGSNVLKIVKRHPHLKGTVLDLPTVCANAKNNIARQGLSDTVDTASGDCFVDPYPNGVDTVLFCHFLHLWSEDQCRKILRNAYARLPAGGRAVIFDIMEHDDGSGPLAAAVVSAQFLAHTAGGYMYAAREYEGWLIDVGFKIDSKLRFPDDHVTIVAKK